MEGEIFIDPQEDEVFFRPMATQAQLEAIKKRKNRKTMILRSTDENKENVSVNVTNAISPIKKNASYREVIDEEEEQESIHNTTPFDPDDDKPVASVVDQLVDVSVAEIVSKPGNRRKTSILDWPAEFSCEKALTPAKRDFEDIASLDDDGDLDSLFMDCRVNESLVSWASVDVNAQLESLVANMENLMDDEEDDDPDFYISSTPQKSEKSFNLLKTPKMTLKADNDGGYLSALSEAAVAVSREQIIPSVLITEPTPEQEVTKSPAPMKSSSTKIHRPVKLVYKDEDNSSSSGSIKSFCTPASFQSTPFLKPSMTSVPKSSGLRPRMTPGSKIPTGVKQSASKSLQFTHIESPVTKYIHQKSTPLVCNVKPKKSSSVIEKTPLKVESLPKERNMPELPAARYQKGIPLKQEKAAESKLPRLGPVQLGKIKPLSPRVVKHNPRDQDVSVLVSSEVKIRKTPRK